MSPKILKFVPAILIIGILITAVLVMKNVRVPKSQGPGVKKPHHEIKALGPDSAPITITEFSDFQCPSCAFAQEPLKDLIKQFPEMIRVEFKHFPLEMHRFAKKASIFSECALEHGKFWEYQDLLFDKQSIWSRDPDADTLFLAFGNTLGISPIKLLECQANPGTERRVALDKQSGDALKVQSTPTFFINSERVVGGKQLKEAGPGIVKKILQSVVEQRT